MNEELELVNEALKQFGQLLRNICGPTSIEIGETLGAWARYYRINQAVKMLHKTQRMLNDAGIYPREVPKRLFLPILDKASIEDDEEMQTRWAALLANASAKTDSVHPTFIDILSQLTPQDAQLLDKLYDHCKRYKRRVARPWVENMNEVEYKLNYPDTKIPIEEFQVLVRLGLISLEYDMDESKVHLTVTGVWPSFSPPKLESGYELTEFADWFVEACRAPVADQRTT